MASIRKIKGYYYSRIVWRGLGGKQVEKTLPLKTKLKSEAIIRNNEVEYKADTIKDGDQWDFPWMSDGGKAKLIRKTISECFEEYISVKRIDGCRQKTIDINSFALKNFMQFVGFSNPIDSIEVSHINEWKDRSRRIHAPSTTNIYLSKLKTFFRFCFKRGYIKTNLEIEMVKEVRKPPMYLSEKKLRELFSTDLINEHYRKAFLFYAMTGCRLTEPFIGELVDDWLLITPDVAKSHSMREIQLNEFTKYFLFEMRERFNSRIGKSGYGSKSITAKGIIDTYSKEFKKGVKALGFGHHKFHNLRDTFAVRRWIECGDIHLVSKEIGHASVLMTQKYADFNLRRLQVDFPSLRHIVESRITRETTNSSLINMCEKNLLLV